MKQIKLNPLNASKFFDNLLPIVVTEINRRPTKIGLASISRSEAFNGEVPRKIIQNADPSIGLINKTISPIVSETPAVMIIPKTEPFNGEVPGKADINVDWKPFIIFTAVIGGAGLIWYLADRYMKNKDKENNN